MTAQRIHWRGAILLCILSGVFMACESVDTGVESTLDSDYTIILQVMEQSVHVGDQTPLVLKLKRTDNSNLPNGMQGSIVITTSAHGGVDASAVPIEVGNDRTQELVRNLVFTAQTPGVAEVRATFRDATAQVKVFISNVNI